MEKKYELLALLESGKSAPEKFETSLLDLTGFSDTSRLPAEIRCHTLIWKNSSITELPEGLEVRHKLDLSGSSQLEKLPAGLSVSVLALNNCTRLEALPENLRVDFLTLDGCVGLKHWPETAKVSIGTLSARGCTGLARLPDGLGPLTTLNLRDCARVEHLPEGMQVRAWVDIGGTQIEGLPKSMAGTGLRWRGVSVTPQIAFFPETLKSADALNESNAEVRRVMIERIGFERFLQECNARVLHEDRDPGGPRQLLQVELASDEPLVCVSVRCPSTGRHYLIRVPPTMRTCHQAVAWTAGFDNPDDYVPVVET
ncbi:DUF6745 domain-containing protein [Prosthecobacter sp.]|uniref:DUF6745 domain-containing protein n=1 Tax=Prosthecobacter sp. TaxID=1965333 RepID=UPI0037842E7E